MDEEKFFVEREVWSTMTQRLVVFEISERGKAHIHFGNSTLTFDKELKPRLQSYEKIVSTGTWLGGGIFYLIDSQVFVGRRD